jgi:hypothetical protein
MLFRIWPDVQYKIKDDRTNLKDFLFTISSGLGLINV